MTHSVPLSPNELRRLHRHLYQFEVFRNHFQDWTTSSDDESHSDTWYEIEDNTPKPDSMVKSLHFLSLFKQGEVEEIACVRDYFCSYYRRMFQG